MADSTTSSSSNGPSASGPPASAPSEVSVGELIDDVVAYAKQETLGPLRGAGRWLGFGVAGAIMLGVGLAIMLLGLLRLLQTEWDRSATGSLSWLSYLIVVVVGAAVIGITFSRIRKTTLSPQHKERS